MVKHTTPATFKIRNQVYLLGLLAMIKCSICSLRVNLHLECICGEKGALLSILLMKFLLSQVHLGRETFESSPFDAC